MPFLHRERPAVGTDPANVATTAGRAGGRPSADSTGLPGKGRPTPKRREAERRRRSPQPVPATRREAYRRRREQIKAERGRMRAALATGDESNLPPRDAGPGRRLARDLVDARRNVAGLFMPVAAAAVVLSLVRSAAAEEAVFLLYVGFFLLMIVDCYTLARRVRRLVGERCGTPAAVGAGWYAVLRAMQLRRWRRPPPKVQVGDPV